jgi:hypothetical protein
MLWKNTLIKNNIMKASYRKIKNGFYPVIIFNDKSRMTHKVLCCNKELATNLAQNVIIGIEKYQKNEKGEEKKEYV